MHKRFAFASSRTKLGAMVMATGILCAFASLGTSETCPAGTGALAESARESRMRFSRQENREDQLFQPAHPGTENFWRPGALWRGMACGRE